jgi:UDP-N-acetylglucosamine--N-acetylmuramyl-(pentapeptide) pyrophosphoryl-undecaprenol N-acetylglucosamine transferase
MDRQLVEGAGIEFFGVPSGKLRRYFSLKTAVDFFRVVAGFFAARKILKKNRVSLLFSKGGFVSVPPCAAAASLGIRVFTHESDFSPGLATRINARFAVRTGGRIFTAYEETARFLPAEFRGHVTVSGNPVRAEFDGADAAKGRAFLGSSQHERILLVLGGSQGAMEINTLVRAALPRLIQYYTVVHQYGPAHDWDLPQTERYKPFPFIKEELPHVMAAAELVLARSGAGTVSECAFLGKPRLLLPLRGSGTRGDQVENARFFEEANAARVLPQAVDAETLAKEAASLADDKAMRNTMAQASIKTGKRDSSCIIARVLADTLEKNNETGGN